MNIKEENFNRIANTRVQKIIESISKLKNLANRSFYDYTDDQIEELFKKIQAEIDKEKEFFKNSNKSYKGNL